MVQLEAAQALPRKQFFLEMFTRDISLEDCMLDLVDNSIDSHLVRKNIEITPLIFGNHKGSYTKGSIKVRCNEDKIEVFDDCGGIDYQDALTSVFCFGHDPGQDAPKRLGAYGIGLKRAIFKMGDQIDIRSQTTDNGFEVNLNVPSWAARETDWTIPIKPTKAAKNSSSAGTEITITKLRNEVKMRLKDGSLLNRLHKDVAQTYSFFLEKCADVTVNGTKIEPDPIPIGGSSELEPARDSFTEDDVKVTLVAAIAPPGQRTTEKAGWYILCNGRIVVPADKSDLTGWGMGVPLFHNKFTRFVGLALFESSDTLKLPWTTTKRWVNTESAIFQHARNRMASMTRPITKFLSDLYPPDPAEKSEYRDLLNSVKRVELGAVAKRPSSTFKVGNVSAKPKPDAKVVYNVPSKAMDRVRKCINRPSLSNSEIGKYTFNHFLKTECPD